MRLQLWGFCLAAMLLLVGCGENKPVTAVVLFDASASSASLWPAMQKSLRSYVAALDPTDEIYLLRMAGDVYTIYRGRPDLRAIDRTMSRYGATLDRSTGTGYGAGLNKAVSLAQQKKDRRTVVVVLGDGADERGRGRLNLKTFPQRLKKLPQDTAFAFLFIDPRRGSQLEQSLQPVLAERLIVATPADADAKIGSLLEVSGR